MAAVDVVETLGVCYVAEEATFGSDSGATFVRAHPVAESLDYQRTQEQVTYSTLKVRPFDVVSPIKGNKGATVKLDYLLQPASTRLTAGATVPTGASRPPLWVFHKALFGGESVFAGSDLTGTPTTSGGDVTAGQGARLPAGQLCLIQDPTDGFVAARIQSRATDTLTWWPNLDNAPSSGADVVNLPTWYPTRTNSRSLALRLASATDSNYQYSFNGGTGSLEFKLAKGELATVGFDLAFATHSGPDALGYTTTHSADSMNSPLIVREALCYLQEQTTDTRTEYPIDALSVKVNLGNMHLESGISAGGVQGKRAVARTEGLYGPAVEVEITVRADRALDDWYDSRTVLSLMVVLAVDATEGRRAIVIDVPKCVIQELPTFAKGDANLVKTTIKLVGQLDDGCSGTLDNEELAQAPIRVAVG